MNDKKKGLLSIPKKIRNELQVTDNNIVNKLAGKVYGDSPSENADTRIVVFFTNTEKKQLLNIAHQNKMNEINEFDTVSKIAREVIKQFIYKDANEQFDIFSINDNNQNSTNEKINARVTIYVTKSEKKQAEQIAHQNKMNDINGLNSLSKIVRVAVKEFIKAE